MLYWYKRTNADDAAAAGDALPENIQHAETITTLIIENVALKSVPAWFGTMGFVKQLSLRSNKLNKLATEIGKMVLICFTVTKVLAFLVQKYKY